jgi:hypothetical protein
MGDELHQPYRLPLLHGSRELIDLAYARGAAGACLSGAGPTVLAVCDSPVSAHAVEKAWNAAGAPGMATRLRFDTTGARLIAEEPGVRPATPLVERSRAVSRYITIDIFADRSGRPPNERQPLSLGASSRAGTMRGAP